MPNTKLLIYSQHISKCPLHYHIFKKGFTTDFVSSREQFLNKIENFNPDVAVVCLCNAQMDDVEELTLLETLSGPIPLFACCKTLPLEFISNAIQHGNSSFLCCRWANDKIEKNIYDAIRFGGIKEYIEFAFPGSMESSPYINKIITEIIHTFPNRLNEIKIAEKLGISVSWLQKLFRKALKLSFNHFIRRIWVMQALCLMKYTNMDNTEIAFQLNYTEESSLARDFRKELDLNPSEARKQLIIYNPKQLIQSFKSSAFPAC